MEKQWKYMHPSHQSLSVLDQRGLMFSQVFRDQFRSHSDVLKYAILRRENAKCVSTHCFPHLEAIKPHSIAQVKSYLCAQDCGRYIRNFEAFYYQQAVQARKQVQQDCFSLRGDKLVAKFSKKTQQDQCVKILVDPHLVNLDQKLKELTSQEIPHLNIIELGYLSK